MNMNGILLFELGFFKLYPGVELCFLLYMGGLLYVTDGVELLALSTNELC